MFLCLLHCRYAKIHIPIIASVSEHQPTTWTSFFFDLHILLCMFPAGVWFVMRDLKDERLFGICLVKHVHSYIYVVAMLSFLVKYCIK